MFNIMFNHSKPKKEKPVNGMIQYLGLESFWHSVK